MTLYSNKLYIEDLDNVCRLDLPWEKLRDNSILLSGATGLIGSFFVDVIMHRNAENDMRCHVYALTRDVTKAEIRFSKHKGSEHLTFLKADIKNKLNAEEIGKIGYVLHLASNTHPLQYSTDPVGTITTNIIGLQNMMDFALEHHADRFVFASSNEIYGENRGDVELFAEDYCGYIDSNTVRAGYPESKRCGEALCQAYRSQYGLDVVIPRLTRSYGPTMLMSDSKALSQFIKKGIAGEDIVLKSEGNQYYSYQYVSDSVSGLLTVMLNGSNGEAYNIADVSSDIRLKDLAKMIASVNGKQVVFEIPDSVEAAGYSTATKARLDGSKIRALGWRPEYDIRRGIDRTISILKALQ